MADYYTPTVIQQTIAEADMTPLERLLLSHIFEAERDGKGWYFFSEVGPVDMTVIGRVALETALAASEPNADYTANAFVRKLLADVNDKELQDDRLDVDFNETSLSPSCRTLCGARRRSDMCRRYRPSHLHACVPTASAVPSS